MKKVTRGGRVEDGHDRTGSMAKGPGRMEGEERTNEGNSPGCFPVSEGASHFHFLRKVI